MQFPNLKAKNNPRLVDMPLKSIKSDTHSQINYS